jgi:hypothetical protein
VFPGRPAREFLSLVHGHRVRTPWIDQFDKRGSVLRTYFGWEHSCETRWNRSHLQTVPFDDIVESIEYRDEMRHRLPELFTAVRDVGDGIDIAGILHPLWTAHDGIMEDKLALTSVSLERVRIGSAKYRTNADGPTDDDIWKSDIVKRIKDSLVKHLEQLVSESPELQKPKFKSVRETLAKKVENVAQPTNPDQFEAAIAALGLTLSAKEQSAIKKRNQALHGVQTLKETTTTAFNVEAETFDTLRMLVTKAVFAMLKYRGPIIDYSARPDRGNFPIVFLQQPGVNPL